MGYQRTHLVYCNLQHLCDQYCILVNIVWSGISKDTRLFTGRVIALILVSIVLGGISKDTSMFTASYHLYVINANTVGLLH